MKSVERMWECRLAIASLDMAESIIGKPVKVSSLNFSIIFEKNAFKLQFFDNCVFQPWVYLGYGRNPFV